MSFQQSVELFQELQARRAAAYAKLHEALKPQYTASQGADLQEVQKRCQEVGAEVQNEFVEVSRQVKELAGKLGEGAPREVTLGKHILSIQALEKRKLEQTHLLYRARSMIRGMRDYAEREKEDWEAEEEYFGSDLDGKHAPQGVQEDIKMKASTELQQIIEDINDLLDAIAEMADVEQ